MVKAVVLLTVPVCLMVAGCVGGGGGSKAPSAAVAPAAAPATPSPADGYQRVSDATKAGKLVYQGSSVEFSYTSNNGLATGSGQDQTGQPTLTINYGSDGIETGGSISGKLASVLVTETDTFTPLGIDKANLVVSADGKTIILLSDPKSKTNTFDYQVFGVWQTGVNSASGNIGAASFGSVTKVADVPANGSATFRGTALGGYNDATGNQFGTIADASLAVDFGARNVRFATTNTMKMADTTSSASNLNLTGNLTYAQGANNFSGSVNTVGGLNGTANGNFYGPGATEIGGTFRAKANTGVESFVGSFGAKK